MVQQYAPPVNVSPFIRFSRWALLITGVCYGALWNSRFTSYEARMKPIWDQEKIERDAYLKEENARRSKAELDDIEKLMK